MAEHSDENIEKLAQHVLDGMDMNDLMACAKERIEENYKNDAELFNEEWELFKEDL